MRVFIDARLWGAKHTGIGRYVEGLVSGLAQADQENKYILLMRPKEASKARLPGNFSIAMADFGHYSLAEQLRLPGILRRLKVDLAHFPHFNLPVFYRGKFLVTIHDLIKHTSRGIATTTRTPLFYWLKYLGYRLVFLSAVSRAAKILVPSQAVKAELLQAYKIPSSRVVVVYEGVEDKFKSPITNHQSQITLKKYTLAKPYLIYVGNAYPHKNLDLLMQALKLLNEKNHSRKKMGLVIVSARSVFTERLRSFGQKYGLQKYLKFLEFVEDQELAVLYKNAAAFVFPTLSEGFGLPGIEAMVVGTPVVCSDIPVLREVYGDAALYFDPHDPHDIAAKVAQATTDSVTKSDLVKAGRERVKLYSWQKMARETLQVYRQTAEAKRYESGLNL